MVHVGINYRTYKSREPDPDDSWDRGDTEGHIENLYIAKDDYGRSYDGFDTELEPPFYVVYADYYTGDTFGSDYAVAVVGVCKTYDEANDLAREAAEFKGFGDLSNGFYVPWNGYFEHLKDVRFEILHG